MIANVAYQAPEVVVLHCGFEGPCLDAGVIYVPPRMEAAAMSVAHDIAMGIIAPDADIVQIIRVRAGLAEG